MSSTAGKSLRSLRERLQLKYRDVEEASHIIATRNNNPEFVIGLSRLADIENKGTVPSIYRMYSLAAIYGLDHSELLAMYGVSLEQLPGDVTELRLQVTRSLRMWFPKQATVALPLALLNLGDLRTTSLIGRQIQSWGLLPVKFLQTFDTQSYRYALVGTEDWSMYPFIPPGSFVQIDHTRRKVINGGWDSDYSRPIYFLEFRHGYRFSWCTERAGTLILQPHSSSPVAAEVFNFPGEVDIIGQVVAVAMRLDLGKPRRKRSS